MNVKYNLLCGIYLEDNRIACARPPSKPMEGTIDELIDFILEMVPDGKFTKETIEAAVLDLDYKVMIVCIQNTDDKSFHVWLQKMDSVKLVQVIDRSVFNDPPTLH